MAKRKHFSLSIGGEQDLGLKDIGAMAPIPDPNAINKISDERLAKLRALTQKDIAVPKPGNEADPVDTLLPAYREQLIDLDKLTPAPKEWNFFGMPEPDQYALIFQSVYKYGLWHPCTVWEQEDGSYMILGGHTRRQVFKDLYDVTQDEKYLKIPCKVYKHDQINEPTARRIIILTNIAQRAKESAKLRVRCYGEMARLEKVDAFYGSGVDVNAAVAKLFGVSRSSVAFYRRLENLIDPLLESYENKQISQSVANMLCDVQEELQQYIFDKGYHLKLLPSMKHDLKKASTTDDIDKIIADATAPREKYEYVFSTRLKKPNNFDFVPLAVKHDEVKAFKNFLVQSLDLADGLSDKTKKIILEMIK